MTTARELVERLGGRWSGDHGMARCPAHKDKNPSLSISEGEGGKLLFKCHSGCDQLAVLDALKRRGLWPENGAPAAPRPATQSTRTDSADWTPILPAPGDAPDFRAGLHKPPAAFWDYVNAQGQVLGYVARWDKADGTKDKVLPFTFCRGHGGKMEWRAKAFPEPHLWNNPT